MDSSKLQEIGEKLDVSEQDIKELKKKNHQEKRKSLLKNKVFMFWTVISGFIGVSVRYAYSLADDAAYPYSYKIPGGEMRPYLAFYSLAGVGGIIAAIFNRRKKSPLVKEQNTTIFGTVIASILVFTLAYFVSDQTIFSSGLVYGVYSEDMKNAL